MKYTDVIQAHSLGPPSSAPIIMRRRTKIVMQPNEVAKKTRREKLRPSALSMYSGSWYTKKLYTVSINHGTPMPTYMFTELLQQGTLSGLFSFNSRYCFSFSKHKECVGLIWEEMCRMNLQVMFAIAESAVTWRSAAILLATRSGHEVPAASAVNAITYGLTPAQKKYFF
jgi:hypothetical protein